MEFRSSKCVSDKEWDSFLERVQSSHLQSSLWAETKAFLGWEVCRIKAYREGVLSGGAQFLLKRYGLIGAIAYIPRGPVGLEDDAALLESFNMKVKEICDEEKVKMLLIQPDTPNETLEAMLQGSGYERSSLELAPTATIVVELDHCLEDLLRATKRQTRQNITRSQKEGISVEENAPCCVQDFYDLYEQTAKRQQFLPYTKAYYQEMERVFAPGGHFHILTARYDKEPVSSILVISFGSTAAVKVLGWSGEQREKRPNEGLFWAAVVWAKEKGFKYLDLEGIEREAALKYCGGETLPEYVSHSPDQLKYGFGGKVLILPQGHVKFFGKLGKWVFKIARPEVAKQTIVSKLLDLLRKR